MKKHLAFTSLFAFLMLVVSSCSVVKDQTATTNFKRVKYNRHLKFTKSKVEDVEVAENERPLPKTVESFEQAESNHDEQQVYAHKAKNSTEEGRRSDSLNSKSDELVKTEQVEQVLKNISSIEVKPSQKMGRVRIARSDYWWERDIEDWPWLEIVLAIIAILIIAILVSILVSILGGLVSSLLGLILLILLAYILYTLWL